MHADVQGQRSSVVGPVCQLSFLHGFTEWLLNTHCQDYEVRPDRSDGEIAHNSTVPHEPRELLYEQQRSRFLCYSDTIVGSSRVGSLGISRSLRQEILSI